MLLENKPIIRERRIRGIALVPRISRNENLYTKKELARADGVKVPLNWEHDPGKVIGSVTFTYDEEFNQVRYAGELFDFAVPLVAGREVYASIEAASESTQTVCNSPGDCFNMPQGLNFEALALTLSPGVPETSAVMESKQAQNAENSYIYTPPRAVEMQDPPISKADEQPPATAPEDKQLFDGGQTEAPNQEAAPKAKEADAPNMDGGDDDKDKESKCTVSKEMGRKEMDDSDDDDMEERVKRAVAEALAPYVAKTASVEETLKRLHSTPVFGGVDFDGRRVYETLRANGYTTWHVPITNLTRLNEGEGAAPRLTEAVAFTPANSNSSQVVTSDRIFVQPSGKFARSIRHLVRFREIPEGVDTVKELRTGVTDSGTVTEGAANSDATQTITGVTLTADTVTGLTQTIKKADVEDTANDIIGALTEQARIEAMDAEAKLVFDTAADAVSASNIGAWLDNDGDDITADNLTGLGSFDHEALLEARRYFEAEGYPSAPGELKCAIHPKALRELRGDSDIQRYVQEGDAVITRTGALAQLHGIDLLPTVRVAETSGHSNKDAYRNIVFYPQSAFLLASKRDVQIDMLYQPNKFAYEWSWSHRKNATAFDPKAIVRISSEVPA